MSDGTGATLGRPERSDAMPRRRSGRLFRKYILLFVALVGGALLASGALEVWFSYQENKAALARIQHEKALAAAARIDQFIDEMTRQIGWTTRAQWSRTVLEQRRFEYLQLLRQAPAVTEVSHLDANGREELRVSRLAMDVIGSGTDYSSEPKFTEAKARKTWFSPVYYRKESEPYITVAIAGTGRDTGVTVAEVNLKFIWDVISRIKVGQAGYAYVVDKRGLLIAHPDIGLVLRKTDQSALPQVAAALAGGAASGGDEALLGADSAGHKVLTAHAAIMPLDWTVFVDLPLGEAFAPLYASMQRTAALILLGLVLAVGAGLLLARRMVVPIRALEAGAARIGGGSLDHRIDVKTGDEIEALADQFNRMAGQLQESYAGLERKVEERTRELSESLEQQTATAEVLNVISRSRADLQPVLDTLVETAKRVCAADRAFLFRLDGEVYRLAASSTGWSTPEFRDYIKSNPVRPGQGTAVGRTALESRPVQILDAWADAEYEWLDFARKENLRTILGVPLLREGIPIGVFTVNRSRVRAFTEKQIALLTTFADQAVIAIENTRLLTELQQRTDDLTESLEYQTAVSDVLKVISRSRFDLQPVLQTVVETAARLCRAEQAGFFRLEGGVFRWRAGILEVAEYEEIERRAELRAGDGTLVGLAALERRAVRIGDAWTDPSYGPKDEARVGGVRSMLGVPLLREGALLGVFALARRRVEPFTDKEVELVTVFADQAVIAIENVRLLDQLQARTRELGRSVEELTATSEILRVIASSPGQLAPVLQSVAQTAARLCDADDVAIHRVEGEQLHFAAHHGTLARRAVAEGVAIPISRGSAAGRAVIDRQTVHIQDISAQRSEYPDSPVHHPSYFEAGVVRTVLVVPLLREGTAIGTIVVLRSEVRPFTERQIELVTSFADQAVIAIENARLLNEIQQRTKDLSESLEQQTATSEVLKVISRSRADLQPVLDTLVETAKRVCGADISFLFRLDGGVYRTAAWTGCPPEATAYIKRNLIKAERGTIAGRTALEGKPVQILDVWTDPDYEWGEFARLAGYRTGLGVPLLREGVCIGVITVNRSEVKAFTEKQIELMTTFADQAVIAIENARLLEALQERTRELGRSVEELKALGEVGRAVSSTLDLKTVLETVVTRGAELGVADACSIYRYRDKERQFKLWHAAGLDPAFATTLRDLDVNAGETLMGRAVATQEPIQVADLGTQPNMPLRDAALAAGYHAVLIVPLVRASRAFGALVLNRRAPGEFSAGTVNLLRTFASQSILAIQNARLFREIEEKGQQLAIASQHKSQFLANMSHELRTPLNAILGYTELLLDGLYGQLGERAHGVLERVYTNGKHLLGLINDVLDLAKIEAGQLTLTIGDYSVGAMVQSVVAATESLAKSKGLELRAEVAPAMPLGQGDERRLTQVLLNLVGNAIKFTDAGSVTLTALAREGMFKLAVRDTGPGIAESDQARIFEEFQQVDNSSTRKKGGTGLGLAISKQIVEMHGGTISVESQPGAGATFRIDLPIRVRDAREVA